MKNFMLVFGGLVLCYWLFSSDPPGTRQEQSVAPQDIPGGSHTVPDLLPVFRGHGDVDAARQHARKAANMFRFWAAIISLDHGKPASQRRLTTAAQLEDFRETMRDLSLKGGSFLSLYPTLGDAVGAYMKSMAGSTDGSIDEKAPAYIDGYTALATECDRVSKNL